MADQIIMVRDRQFDDEPVIKTSLGPCAVVIDHDQTIAYPINAAMAEQLTHWGYKYADSKAPEPEPEPEPEPDPEPDPDPEPETYLGVEYSILNESVDSLEVELRLGIHDEYLDSLLECEKNSKNRKTAIEAIERRLKSGEE